MSLAQGCALFGGILLGILVLIFSFYLLYMILNKKEKSEGMKFEYKIYEAEDTEAFERIIKRGTEDNWEVCGSSFYNGKWLIVYGRKRN